jgi:hypothetical protein
MIRRLYLLVAVVLALFIMPGVTPDAESGGLGSKKGEAQEIGLIFDIQGFAEMKSPGGKPVKLERDKHLLHVVKAGDKLRVVKEGSISIFSLEDKKIYEIPPNTLVQVQRNGFVAIKGSLNKKETLHSPKAIPGNVSKMFVTTLLPEQACIKAVSPVNTSIDTLTPTLKWDNICKRNRTTFTVKLMAGNEVIYEAVTGETTFKIPKDLLAYAKNYTWLVDGGSIGITGETFSTLSKEATIETLEKKRLQNQKSDDLSLRLSFILYLVKNNLNEQSQKEIVRLKEEFPDIEGLKVIEEKVVEEKVVEEKVVEEKVTEE